MAKNKLLGSERRTAKKAHRCCECRMVINPGDRYTADKILDERGKFAHFDLCTPCAQFRDQIEAAMLNEYGDDAAPIGYGELYSNARELYPYAHGLKQLHARIGRGRLAEIINPDADLPARSSQ